MLIPAAVPPLAGDGWRSAALTDPALYASGDPHAVWAAMREQAPLHRGEAGGTPFVSVTRYADAVQVLGDADAFTSERGSLVHQLGRGDAAAGKMLVSTDPPEHTRLRAALAGTLTPRAVRAHEAAIREEARVLVAAGLDRPGWDLAQAAIAFPMRFTGALMGVDRGRWDDLALWTLQSTAPHDPAYTIGNPARTLAIAHHELLAFFSDEVRRHVDQRIDDDLIGALVAGHDGPGTPEEAVYNCYSLLLGANATTPHALCLTLLALTEFPEQWDRVRSGGCPVATATEEGLRWSSPANSFLRHATRDVELPSGPVRAGEAVAVWVGSANRDETVFDRPFTFDAGRHPNRHITFGIGPHYCIGAALARSALSSVLEELRENVRRIDVVTPPEHISSVFVAGVKRMPVHLVPDQAESVSGS